MATDHTLDLYKLKFKDFIQGLLLISISFKIFQFFSFYFNKLINNI